MKKSELLLKRLSEIGESLRDSGMALALLGLGSVGVERERLDDYSDLDFFAIVREGFKRRFIDNLDWLSRLNPIAYAFLNSADGYKLLFADGIFCEFAVFEPSELPQIPYAEGKIVWKDEGFTAHFEKPEKPLPTLENREESWLIGEALTNVYVGLCRYHRGEKLSAFRFVENYAIDRIVELTRRIEQERGGFADPFTDTRRFETRFPRVSESLPKMMQGYERVRESAWAIVQFLNAHFTVNQAMLVEIEKLVKTE